MATGRPSTVERHPQLSRIDSMLDDGVAYAEISARFGVSLSAVGRYAISRKSTLAKVVADEPNITDVVPRLIEAADHAQEFRRKSRLSGSAVQQARAIKGETDVLAHLVTELGITDTTVAETLTEALALANAVASFVRARPYDARALLEHMAGSEELSDFRKTLKQISRNAS